MSRILAPLLAAELASELSGDELSSDAWVRRAQLLERLPRELRRIPALPKVVTEVLALSHQPNGDARRMEQALTRDTVIAGRMLHLANSSFYQRARPLCRVSEAVVALGHSTVRSLVLAASVENLLSASGESLGYRSGGLWVHGLAVGMASKELAAQIRPDLDREEVLLAGLLHDAGRLPMMDMLGEQADAWVRGRKKGMGSERVEQATLGVHHGELGARVANKWYLPPVYGAVAALHHHPPVNHEHADLIAIVHLADAWATRAGFGLVKAWRTPVEKAALEVLGRSLAEIVDCMERARDDIERISAELVPE